MEGRQSRVGASDSSLAGAGAAAKPVPVVAPRRRRRPRWSLKTVFFGGILVAVISLLLVHGLARADLWRELQWVAAGGAAALFAFLAVALYLGLRWLPRERVTIALRAWSLDDVQLPDAEPRWSFGSQADSFAGLVLGIVLDVVATVLLALVVATLVWLGVNLAVVTLGAVFLPLFALFRRSLRTVVARGRHCRGQLRRSLWHALLGAFLYGTWLYAVLLLIDWLRR